jgi:cytoskeletal protein CcmA (bactofilin family)
LGSDSEVTGKLSFTAPTRIDGKLRGEVCATDMLVIGETGVIDGTIRAVNLIILGRVKGDVVGAERVEIGPKGRLNGHVETRALVVREGGLLEADCLVSPPRAQIHFLDKRREPEESH